MGTPGLCGLRGRVEWRFGFVIRTGDVDSFAHSPNAPFGFFGGIPPQLSAEAPLFLMPFRLAAGHRVFFDLEDLRDFRGTGGRLPWPLGEGPPGSLSLSEQSRRSVQRGSWSGPETLSVQDYVGGYQ